MLRNLQPLISQSAVPLRTTVLCVITWIKLHGNYTSLLQDNQTLLHTSDRLVTSLRVYVRVDTLIINPVRHGKLY